MIHTKKSLGQNFLVNKGVLDKIVNTVELNKNDTILEIGPGTGVLTEKLAETLRQNTSSRDSVPRGSGQEAGRVIAIEKDHRLIDNLKEKFKNSNVDIIEADILKLKIETLIENCKLKIENYKIVGNIPYYITSHLLKTIFEKWPMPKLIVLMVQKEVAQRIVAKPPHMSILALSVQFYAEPKIISYVSRGSFRPMPKVDSAIIRLKPNDNQRLTTNNQQQFFKLIKTAFAGKRKQLKNTLDAKILIKSGIKPESRPEELSLDDWIRIASNV